MMSSSLPLICGHCGTPQPEPPSVSAQASQPDLASKRWVSGYVGSALLLVLFGPALLRGCANLTDREGRARREQEERDRRALGG
jgi:hypothetical protein